MIQAIPSMYIYLHLVNFYGKCRSIYIYIFIYIHNIPYMDPMGHVNELTSLEEL